MSPGQDGEVFGRKVRNNVVGILRLFDHVRKNSRLCTHGSPPPLKDVKLIKFIDRQNLFEVRLNGPFRNTPATSLDGTYDCTYRYIAAAMGPDPRSLRLKVAPKWHGRRARQRRLFFGTEHRDENLHPTDRPWRNFEHKV